MASISLSRLLDLAIGTPEVGAVNFNILYRLLHAMLQKLELKDYETDIGDMDRDPFAGNKLLAIAAESHEPSPYHQLEKKVTWVLNQIEQLNALPSTKQLSDQVQEKGDNENPLSNMWQYMQLKKRVETNEEGIQKLLSMLSDLMKQIDTLEVSNASLLGKLDDLDLNNTHLKGQIAELNGSLNILSSRFDKLPSPEDISNFVTWNNLQDALNGMPRSYPSGNFGNICGYFGQLLNMTSNERRAFIDDAIQSDTIHQYLPRIDDNFFKMEPSEKYQYIEDIIEKDTLKTLLPQSGSDLLKMNPTERGNFVEDAIKWGTLRVYLPGLEPNFEPSSFEERVNTVEDAIKNGNFHMYFPCKFQNVNQMSLVQRKASIDNAIGYGSVEPFLPGVKSLTEKMGPDDREKFVEQAAKSGLAETYQDVTGNEPPPLANLKREIDKAIIKECQTLMYENNGVNETELAKEPLASLVDVVTPARPQSARPQSARPQSAQNEFPRPASRASTPGTIISAASFGGSGPTPDLLEILERLGSLNDQHNKLVKWVKSINARIKEKAREHDLNKLEERVRILEELINQKLDKDDLAKSIEQIEACQYEVETIRNMVEELKDKEAVVKAPFPDIVELLENRLCDSGAFVELMERVGGIESKLVGFQDSLKLKDSAYSSEILDTLSFLQDSMSEISSDPEAIDSKRHRRRVKSAKTSKAQEKESGAQEPPESTREDDDSRFANVAEGSITHNIIAMLAETVENCSDEMGTDILKRLGLILDDQLEAVVDKIGGLGEDLKLMAKGVEVALASVQSSDIRLNTSSIDEETLAHAQNALGDLQIEIKKLQKTTGDIINANNQKQKQIDNIIKYSEQLYENKADKDYVLGEFDSKADKRQLESKVNYSLFNKATDEINKTIREVEAKLEGNEGTMSGILQQLSEDVDGKLDKLEMDPLKSWLEGRLRELNKKIAKTQPDWSEDDAAGLRKQLIQRFHCLSCDKTINVMPKNPISSLPLQTAMPNTRSPRPYTIFELDQIRQRVSKGLINQNIVNFERALMERQHARIKKSDLRAFLVHFSNELDALGIKHDVTQAHNSIQETADTYARTRPCGGLHTMTFPHRRTIKISNLNKTVIEEEPKPEESHSHRHCGVESEVQGADGVIYKGRCGHIDHCHGPKGTKVLRKVLPPSTSQPPPRPSSRPGSARNRPPARPGSARSSSRPVSARPNTVQAIREEDGTPVTSPGRQINSDDANEKE